MPDVADTRWRYLWGLVLLALFVAVSFQGSRGLYETSEGRYAECAREMVETGNYMEPALSYRPHWTKPPLTYWAIASGIRILGTNEWGARAFNIVAFFLTVLGVVSLGATLWDRRTGIVAGFIYATSPFPVFGAYSLTTDTLLTLWEILAVLCYLKACRRKSPETASGWITAMWFFWGLGFLTKGPPALLPLVPLILWHLWNRAPVRLLSASGIVLFLVIGFSWYLAVSIRHPELFSFFLGQEVVARIASDSVHHHEWYRPFTIYLPVVLFGAGPWVYFGIEGLWKGPGKGMRGLKSLFQKGRPGAFALLWLLIPLIIFSLVKSRLYLYVLPLHAPISLLLARGTVRREWTPDPLKRVAVIALITALILVGAKGVIAFFPSSSNMKQLHEAVVRAVPDQAGVVVFNHDKLYGLQFYLDGRLRRVTVRGDEAWSDGRLDDSIGDSGARSSGPWVFTAEGPEARTLCSILSRKGVDFRRFEEGDRVICRVEGDPSL